MRIGVRTSAPATTIVLLLAILVGCRADSSDSSGTPSGQAGPGSSVGSPDPTEPETSTPEPSEASGPPAIDWEDPAPFDGQPAEILVDGDAWIAVGWSRERGPGAWTSIDGVSWEAAEVVDPQPDDTFRGAGLGPTVRLGDTLLSYGTFVGCCDGRGIYAWRSAAGKSWEVLESDSPLFQTGYIVNELVVGDPALVAVEGRYAQYTGRIWRWTEDSSWVETTPGTAGTEESSGMATEDVAWGAGRYVVVGSRGDPAAPGPIAGASWTSTDGETWEESAPAAELEDVVLLEVASTPGGGFVALGVDDAANSGTADRPVSFTSPDGLSWTAVETPAVGEFTRPHEVIPVEGGLVALLSEGAHTTVVWTSADGSTWTDAGRFESSPIAAASLDDTIIVIGADFEADSDGGYVLHRGTLSR